jgi:benzodiazapine receptor
LREIASKGQLRLAYLRWAVVTVPFILLLGLASATFFPAGSKSAWFNKLTPPDHMLPETSFLVILVAVYVLMGLALAMIINARGSSLRGPALIVFAVQMALNLAWIPIFFGMHQVMTALIVLVALAALVLVTILLFGRIRLGAAVLLLPYLGWICYAGFLLYQIDKLNPDAGAIVTGTSRDQVYVDQGNGN